jgi:hypothetical protein
MCKDTALDNVARDITRSGYAIRDHAVMQDWLGPAWSGWRAFSQSWDQLAEDAYMADGGRYRRRRFAVFDVTGQAIDRAPHQPHFQALAYNRLNGGVARWFEPVSDAIAAHPITRRIVGGGASIFQSLFGGEEACSWHVEMHQFRIEAVHGRSGLPTPEGIHRDGVDGVVVMLVDRRNVSSGVTELFDAQGRRLGAFTLAHPGDCVFLDDARILHGVTPIVPLDPAGPGIRDVLVVTFQRRRGTPG